MKNNFILKRYCYIKNFLENIIILFINKYNMKPFGACPVQAEGYLPTGEYYYFRSRHESWSVRIAEKESDIFTPNAKWSFQEKKYNGYEGGWISNLEAVRNFNLAIKKYYKDIKQSN